MLYGRLEELSLELPKVAVVAGVGGVGYYVALQLILDGVERIYLFDEDKLEEHNRTRIPFSRDDVGKYKVDLMKEYGEKLRPELFIFARREWATPESLGGMTVDLLMDCTDKLESQKALSKWAKQNKTKYIRVGCTTNHITTTNHVGGWTTKAGQEDERCGVTIPSHVSPCMIAAGYGMMKAAVNKELEVSRDVSVE